MRDEMTVLEVSELRYRRLFEGARDGILILDFDTLRIVDANPYLQELLEYTKDELLGKELWEIGLIKDQAESQHLYRELQEQRYLRYDDLPLKSKDGHARAVEFVANVYEEGSHSVIQCNIRDISQRKLVEAQREKLAQVETLKLLGEMARGVAHDLNQSLGLISGYSDLVLAALAESPPDRRVLQDMTETIAQAATDGGLIVSRLLTFARGQPEGPAEPVPLSALLTHVGQLTAPRWRDAAQAEGRSISLVVETEPDLVILGWPASLREALVNLIFNAVDALPQGGAIRLRAHRSAESVSVEVQDSGIGMSAEVREQALRPLFTTKGTHGTGLGLTQVLAAVEQHDGQLTIMSAIGNGTTVRLVLPADRVAVDPSTDRSHGGRPAALDILVVDDEPALAGLLAHMLSLEGHTVTVDHSGAAALERLEVKAFDVVISDMGMPGMDGWELIRQVRSRYPATQIIIVSGWGSQITAEEVHERGVHAVVAKPYRRADIRQVIATLHVTPPSYRA